MMDENMFEITKKNVASFDIETAERFIYDLTRNRRLSFEEFKELCEIHHGRVYYD